MAVWLVVMGLLVRIEAQQWRSGTCQLSFEFYIVDTD